MVEQGNKLLSDLKTFLESMGGERLTEKKGLIPRKKCFEINEKILGKDTLEENERIYCDQTWFFHLNLLRALSEVTGLGFGNEQTKQFVVNDNKEFFSKTEEEQLNQLFFNFFVETGWSALLPHPGPVPYFLETQSEKITRRLKEQASSTIKTEKILEGIIPTGKRAEWFKPVFEHQFEIIVLETLEYFGAAKFEKSPSDDIPGIYELKNVKITERGKKLLEELLHSKRHLEKLKQAIKEAIAMPLTTNLAKEIDIKKLRELEREEKKFFQKYESVFLAIEAAILDQLHENPELEDKEALEAVKHLRENISNEENENQLEERIRNNLKITAMLRKTKHKQELSTIELKTVLGKVAKWIKNHADEGKQGYLEFLEEFMKGNLQTEEDIIEYQLEKQPIYNN